MRTEQQFVPLDKVESDILQTPGNTVHLPEWANRSQVGIDVKYIERLCRFAGINTLTIRTVNDSIFGARNKPDIPCEPDILDDIAQDVIESTYNALGTTLEQEWAKQVSTTKSVPVSMPIKIMCHRSDLTIALNIDAIESRLVDENLDSLLNLMNDEIISCLRSAGVVELGATGYNVVGAITYLLLVIIGKKLGGVPVALLLPMFASISVMLKYQMQGMNPRFSLTGLTGMEIDRLAIFSYLARTRTLIRRIT